MSEQVAEQLGLGVVEHCDLKYEIYTDEIAECKEAVFNVAKDRLDEMVNSNDILKYIYGKVFQRNEKIWVGEAVVMELLDMEPSLTIGRITENTHIMFIPQYITNNNLLKVRLMDHVECLELRATIYIPRDINDIDNAIYVNPQTLIKLGTSTDTLVKVYFDTEKYSYIKAIASCDIPTACAALPQFLAGSVSTVSVESIKIKPKIKEISCVTLKILRSNDLDLLHKHVEDLGISFQLVEESIAKCFKLTPDCLIYPDQRLSLVYSIPGFSHRYILQFMVVLPDHDICRVAQNAAIKISDGSDGFKATGYPVSYLLEMSESYGNSVSSLYQVLYYYNKFNIKNSFILLQNSKFADAKWILECVSSLFDYFFIPIYCLDTDFMSLIKHVQQTINEWQGKKIMFYFSDDDFLIAESTNHYKSFVKMLKTFYYCDLVFVVSSENTPTEFHAYFDNVISMLSENHPDSSSYQVYNSPFKRMFEDDLYSRYELKVCDKMNRLLGDTSYSISQKSLTTFEAVSSLEDAKAELKRSIILPLRHPELFDTQPQTGLLFYGPPGCGKTLLAKALAGEIGECSFMSIKGPELMNKYIGETEKTIREIFQIAKSRKRCVLFFDELDALLGRASSDGPSAAVSSRIVSQFATELENIVNKQNQRNRNSFVVVIAATNREDLLDPLLKRPGRFDKSIFIGPPTNEKDISMFIRTILKKFQIEYSDEDLQTLTELVKPGTLTGAEFHGINLKLFNKLLQRKSRGEDETIGLEEVRELLMNKV